MDVIIGTSPQNHELVEQASTDAQTLPAQVSTDTGLTDEQSAKAGLVCAPHDHENPDFSDPMWCKREMQRLYLQLGRAEESQDRMKVQTQLKTVPEMYRTLTGLDLADASQVYRTATDILQDGKILEMNEEMISKAEAAVKLARLDDEGKKKIRWLYLLDRLKRLQATARRSAAAAWAYFGESDSGMWPIQFAKIHRGFFKALSSPGNCIVMAPPRHGKSLAVTGYVLYRIQADTSIRILLLFADRDQAGKQVNRLKRYIRSNAKYHALFPHVRLLSSSDDEQDSVKRFTVNRPNVGGREPTVEGCSIGSNVQGNGYDLILADDINVPAVAEQEELRRRNNFEWMNVIERRVDTDPKTGVKGEIKKACTPWHEEDTAGIIIREMEEGRRPEWKLHRIPVEDDARGVAISLWPELYGSPYYEQQKRDPHVDYGRLFRLETKPQESRLVKRLRFYPASDADPNLHLMGDERVRWARDLHQKIGQAEQWLSIDPSGTSAKTSTLTAITQIAMVEGTAYVRAAWFMKGDPVALREWVVEQIAGPELYAERRVMPDDDDVIRARKRAAAQVKQQARGPIKYVLIDSQGSQKIGTTMFSNDIPTYLRDMGVTWGGSVIERDTRGTGTAAYSHQHKGKDKRLAATASYLVNGQIVFPATVVPTENGKITEARYEPGPDKSIQRLVHQILNFPVGTNDGVDTVTQFLLEVFHRFASPKDEPTPQVPTVDSLNAALRAQIEELRKARPVDLFSRDEELEWLVA